MEVIQHKKLSIDSLMVTQATLDSPVHVYLFLRMYSVVMLELKLIVRLSCLLQEKLYATKY